MQYSLLLSTLYMLQAVFPPIIRSQIAHTTHGVWQTCSQLPLAWVSWQSPMLAVAASKLDVYQVLYAQFELLMMGGKTA